MQNRFNDRRSFLLCIMLIFGTACGRSDPSIGTSSATVSGPRPPVLYPLPSGGSPTPPVGGQPFPSPMDSSGGMGPSPNSLLGKISRNPDYSIFIRALMITRLTMLLDSGVYTIFVPNNAAFARMPGQSIESLLANKPLLQTILFYHIVPGSLPLQQLMKRGTVLTISQGTLIPVMKNRLPFINNARIVVPDLAVSNGVLHGVDTVLQPPTL